LMLLHYSERCADQSNRLRGRYLRANE